MTAEDILERNPRYLTRAKNLDSFIMIGPGIVTQESNGLLQDVEGRTQVKAP